MPATYLLLRNNKQTGPFQLDALLQQGLQPHDLIWVEGQSAGWRHPSEIDALKPHTAGKQHSEIAQEPRSNTKLTPSAPDQTPKPAKNATHIYVSLPAGMRPQPQETPPADALEAKAEALHQRIQAFAQGKVTAEDTDIRPARSLDNMKQEYGAWLKKKEKKKKWGAIKRTLAIAGAVLIITTSVFAISKWVRSKPSLSKPSIDSYATTPMMSSETEQTTTASFHTAIDSFTATGETHSVRLDTVVKRPPLVKNTTKPVTTVAKKNVAESLSLPAVAETTIIAATTPIPETTPPPKTEKKLVPLSRLVVVSGTLNHDKKGNNGAATQITLQNNSGETLKSVAVTITYFKKEDRQLGKETVHFYNVLPATAPVISISGNRRATAARFEIGTITRADGSLYLIH